VPIVFNANGTVAIPSLGPRPSNLYNVRIPALKARFDPSFAGQAAIRRAFGAKHESPPMLPETCKITAKKDTPEF